MIWITGYIVVSPRQSTFDHGDFVNFPVHDRQNVKLNFHVAHYSPGDSCMNFVHSLRLHFIRLLALILAGGLLHRPPFRGVTAER
jgi:hypothetical protein